MDLRAIQTRLNDLGFSCGEVDGIHGRKTIAAIAAFQAGNKVPVRWPGTVGPKTLTALFGEQPSEAQSIEVSRPWYDLALRKKSLHEGRDHDELVRFLKSDGKTLGDPRELPWCGDFVETCVALALPGEALPVNPYLARNWLRFGVECQPATGAVAVFWRGKKEGTSGHVGFIAGRSEDSRVLYVLGGNQSNAVTVAPIAGSRLLGTRWPKTATFRGVQMATMKGGVLSTNEA